MNADEANRALQQGIDDAAAHEPALIRKYETILRQSAREIAARYRRTSEPVLAAGHPQPTLYELVQPDKLKDTVAARTRAAQLAMAYAAGVALNPTLTRAFYEPLVAAQAGRQTARVVAGTQSAAAAVMLDGLANGWSVDQTAQELRDQLGGMADWQARMFARTDLVSISNAASQQAASALGDGGPGYKTWVTAGDDRVRPTHVDAEGQTVAIDDTYTVGSDELMYPGDPDGSDEETINCFPGGTLVVAASAEIGFRRWYDGQLVVVETDAHHVLAGTPNHPILTASGWQRLGELGEGDHLVCGALREDEARVAPHVDHAPAMIEDVFRALARDGVARGVGGRPVQFHGDGSDGEVEVVTAARGLRDDRQSVCAEPFGERSFVLADEVAGAHATPRSSREVVLAATATSDRRVGGGGKTQTLLGGGSGHAHEHRLRPVPGLDPEIEETSSYERSTDSVPLGQSLLGDAFAVSLAKIVQVKREMFRGDVFNLQTESGAYLAGGVIVHNCRCVSVFVDSPDAELAHSDAGGITYPAETMDASAAPGSTLPLVKSRRREILEQYYAEQLTAAGPTTAERKQMAKTGVAMSDGSYYIRNASDLQNAIKAVGRGSGSHDAIRAHIIRRAKALGLSSRIPDNWASDGSMTAASALKLSENAVNFPQGTVTVTTNVTSSDTTNTMVAAPGDPTPVDDLLVDTLEELREACTMLAYANDEVIDELEDAAQVAEAVGDDQLGSSLRDRMAYHQSVQDQVMAWLGPAAPPLDVEPDDDAAEASVTDSLYASAAGQLPFPRDWFFDPEPDEPTPFTVTADGKVYGHLAEWDRCHSGYMNSCVLAPRSPSAYQFFHVGQVLTEDGPVDVGKVTVGTGHAGPHLSAGAAREHYDHTGAVAAYVRVVDGKHGPWLTGSIEPSATDAQIRALRANGPSGDWRNITRRAGGLDLLGILSVPKQGFVTPRALVASGEDGEFVLSLIAGGDVGCDCADASTLVAMVEAVLDPQEVRLSSRRAA